MVDTSADHLLFLAFDLENLTGEVVSSPENVALHDWAVLDFDDKPRIEGSPLSRISSRVGDDPELSDPVIDLLMDVTMHPQCRLPFDDKVLHIRGVAGR